MKSVPSKMLTSACCSPLRGWDLRSVAFHYGPKCERYASKMKYITLLIILLAGCTANPANYTGIISYSDKKPNCELLSQKASVEPGTELKETKALAELAFKKSALTHKANYVHVFNHSIIHINAKNPKKSGMYYRVEANLYRCKNA